MRHHRGLCLFFWQGGIHFESPGCSICHLPDGLRPAVWLIQLRWELPIQSSVLTLYARADVLMHGSRCASMITGTSIRGAGILHVVLRLDGNVTSVDAAPARHDADARSFEHTLRWPGQSHDGVRLRKAEAS
jgi:hypothetical protein